jgi:hypothetical protein
MHRIDIWPDIRPAGYPASLTAGYQVLDIRCRLDTGYPAGFSTQYENVAQNEK